MIASPREDAIKSGFMYNFARYSEGKWFNAPLMKSYNICSFNDQFVLTANQTLKNRSIKNVPVSVLFLTSEFANIDHCHTLFISKEDIDKWSYLSKYLAITTIMLVGEFDDFILTGGHINFFSARWQNPF
ncbi:YfiR family protein [Psychromonas sp. KJ10-10]|uniref:YfiR family protein n=1 Tax=Psychromonas sp. KJ10-10 TaxID=3391823 RepID=UPI0039B4A1D4